MPFIRTAGFVLAIVATSPAARARAAEKMGNT